MALDKEPVRVSYALSMAKYYYDEKTYNHALRVMQYVADNDMIPFEYKEDCLSLAIMHDLLEDTKYTTNTNLGKNFCDALQLLTRKKDEDYIDYIKRIKNTTYTSWGTCAYWVKIADMKDHLTQKETLTDTLKEKYLNALPYLL